MLIGDIAKHLQLLDGKTRKQSFDILFNIGNISTHFRYLLSVTHSEHQRDKLKAAYELIELVAHPVYSLRETITRLLERRRTKVTADMVYVIYKIVNHQITPSMYTNLQASLGYTVQYDRINKSTPKDLYSCAVCGKLNTLEVCKVCSTTLEEFTEYRRESFQVPINHFNFLGVAEGEFSYKYKDWVIGRIERTPVVYFELLDEYIMEAPEQYPLPFTEYQKEILS